MAANFKTVIDMGSDHLAHARAIDHVFQEAIAPATVNFDFDNIREAAAIPDGVIVKTVRGWGLQEYAPIMVMVLSLKEVCASVGADNSSAQLKLHVDTREGFRRAGLVGGSSGV